MNIYVASSWRNQLQPRIVRALLLDGYNVYDFRNPPDGDKGFHWSEIDPDWKNWSVNKYINSLSHPLAVSGFKRGFDAMEWADVCVMVMPCGRSAHLEAGYFVGANKKLIILTSDGEPELMYKMADSICSTFNEVVKKLEIFEKELLGSVNTSDNKASAPCPHYRWVLRMREDGGDIVECVHPESEKWPHRT